MKQSFFYDAVMSQAQVWVPKMKPNDFAAIMKRKFEERGKSADYVEEANENLVFVKYFEQYIAYSLLFSKTHKTYYLLFLCSFLLLIPSGIFLQELHVSL